MLFAFYFFTLPAALVHLGLAMTGYALALAAEAPPGSHMDGWLATTGTLLAGGLFVLAVRDRMTALVAGFADAAHRDELTELLNRRGFQEVFDLELERARRAETPLSLIVGDLDRFKRVNDEHGHQAGDDALRRVARTIRSGQARLRRRRAHRRRGVRRARGGLRRARRLHARRAHRARRSRRRATA